MLTSEVLDYTSRSVLCWLATVDETGQPNVSPKEIFAAFDSQHIVVANIEPPRESWRPGGLSQTATMED